MHLACAPATGTPCLPPLAVGLRLTCSLGSPMAAGFLWAACLAYYRSRTRIEERLLEQSFGEQYRQYRSSTGRFVPQLAGWRRGSPSQAKLE